MKGIRPLPVVFLVVLALLAAACQASQPQTPTAPPVTPQPSSTPGPSPTSTVTPTATATPEPLAAQVNGQGITLAEYSEELASFRTSRGGAELTAEEQTYVLEDLIAQELLAQAARANGFSLSGEALDARLQSLVESAGGEAAFAAWLSANGYSQPVFRLLLKRSAEAAWMRDKIAAGVPLEAEQVRARQVLLYNSTEAQQIAARLQSGTDFATIAAEYDSFSLGDLGWFPRGYLLEPAVEAAAFALQPGEVSGMIETRLGYHFIQVTEREPARPLAPDALRRLQELAVQTWVEEQRSSAALQILLP